MAMETSAQANDCNAIGCVSRVSGHARVSHVVIYVLLYVDLYLIFTYTFRLQCFRVVFEDTRIISTIREQTENCSLNILHPVIY